MCESGIVVPRATHYKMGLRNKCSGYEVLHTLIAYALSRSEHRRISGFCFTSAEWSKSLKSVRVCRLILYALASLFILFHYQKSELHCTRRLCLSVFCYLFIHGMSVGQPRSQGLSSYRPLSRAVRWETLGTRLERWVSVCELTQISGFDSNPSVFADYMYFWWWIYCAIKLM